MFSIEHKVSDGEKRAATVTLEKHNGGREGPIEYYEYPLGWVLVLPQAGTPMTVTLVAGARCIAYHVEHRALNSECFQAQTCYADGRTLTLNPCPPFPEARVRVEYDDGR